MAKKPVVNTFVNPADDKVFVAPFDVKQIGALMRAVFNAMHSEDDVSIADGVTDEQIGERMIAADMIGDGNDSNVIAARCAAIEALVPPEQAEAATTNNVALHNQTARQIGAKLGEDINGAFVMIADSKERLDSAASVLAELMIADPAMGVERVMSLPIPKTRFDKGGYEVKGHNLGDPDYYKAGTSIASVWADIYDASKAGQHVNRVIKLLKSDLDKLTTEEKTFLETATGKTVDMLKHKRHMQNAIKRWPPRRTNAINKLRTAALIIRKEHDIEDQMDGDPNVLGSHRVRVRRVDADLTLEDRATLKKPFLLEGYKRGKDKNGKLEWQGSGVLDDAITVTDFLKLNINEALANGGTALALASTVGKRKPKDNSGGDKNKSGTKLDLTNVNNNQVEEMIVAINDFIDNHAKKVKLIASLTSEDSDPYLVTFGNLTYAMVDIMKPLDARYQAAVKTQEEHEKKTRHAKIEAAMARTG
jgi:hypothetical protein